MGEETGQGRAGRGGQVVEGAVARLVRVRVRVRVRLRLRARARFRARARVRAGARVRVRVRISTWKLLFLMNS